MRKRNIPILLSEDTLRKKVYIIRNRQVMLDSDLAELYGVPTKYLNKAVNRNTKRFPDDFMFQLSNQEYKSLRFQIGTLKRGRHPKYLPKVFTREGVSMLSGLLNTDRAIYVNIFVMRVFWKIEDIAAVHRDVLIKLEEFENKLLRQNKRIKKGEKELRNVLLVLRQLLDSGIPAERKRIGYKLTREG
jgi:hypothetical protein